ncbi:DUF1906 domain-containing protein [Gordonia hydrophobica]|uniref:DUF1906 domain-containing protein n=1 Tax=Gordonia hydrophobica TaxID=40516 RepID=A0ABZ2U056_9ACTN|nr:DUF1906 domain-containing protein [Gordonia hydrophobica]MBM7367817.1 hypothetical protein [Gordonia hydrophobica]
MTVTRRAFLTGTAGAAVAGLTALTVPGRAAAVGSSDLPPSAAHTDFGTLLDYSAKPPSAAAIADAGFTGVIRYVSQRRPGAEWMLGKPFTKAEADALRAAGRSIVSCYQYGRAETADWLGGFAAGVEHARRGVEIHAAAGGPPTAPIYASIDDDPSELAILTQVIPYLFGWRSVVGAARVGVYANAPTIQTVSSLGAASWFWQHNWGTPANYVHPSAHLQQLRGQRTVGGTQVDLNTIHKPAYGQW